MSCIYIYNIGHLSFIVSITISYVSYCKVKPQWVIQPKEPLLCLRPKLGQRGIGWFSWRKRTYSLHRFMMIYDDLWRIITTQFIDLWFFLMIYDTNRGIIRFGDLSTGLLTTYCNAHPSVRLGRSLCAGLPLFSDMADDRHEPRRLLRHGGHWSKGAHPRAPLSPGQSRRPARARHPAHRADDGTRHRTHPGTRWANWSMGHGRWPSFNGEDMKIHGNMMNHEHPSWNWGVEIIM